MPCTRCPSRCVNWLGVVFLPWYIGEVHLKRVCCRMWVGKQCSLFRCHILILFLLVYDSKTWFTLDYSSPSYAEFRQWVVLHFNNNVHLRLHKMTFSIQDWNCVQNLVWIPRLVAALKMLAIGIWQKSNVLCMLNVLLMIFAQFELFNQLRLGLKFLRSSL